MFEMMQRPPLNDNISLADFKDFYWLKAELVAFCKSRGIRTTGGKQELATRIIAYLQTGIVEPGCTPFLPPKTSKFDWRKAALDLNTQITDNYKNTENVRAFMTQEIGSHFRFNVPFLNWTKQNVGKTMRDAIAEWHRIYELKKDKNYKTEIASQFEYNTYIRDFLADNKGKTLHDALCCWKWKRSQRGDNKYAKADMNLLLRA